MELIIACQFTQNTWNIEIKVDYCYDYIVNQYIIYL